MSQMAAALPYLNPSLSASSRLFGELNRDSRLLSRFVVASSQLVTDLADRREDLAGLVDDLATTTTAIGSRQAELSDSIARLPDVMRRANTTFVNLRATRLPDVVDIADLLSAHGVWAHRWGATRTGSGSHARALLTLRCSADELRTALGAVGSACGCVARSWPIVEVNHD